VKILVTGAAGFIGSHLCERLKSLGHDVAGLDSYDDYYSIELKKLNAKDLKEQGIKVEKVDLAEDDLTEIVKDVEIVYHVAAQPGISSKVPFEKYVRNNITSTFRLVEAVEKSKTLKMFINTTTSSVYGAHATDAEDAAPKPTSYYGVTKLAAEQLVLAYYRDKNFPACAIRPFSVYGERERPEKLYPMVIHSMLDEKYKFPFFEGSESHLRSYTYIGDIIDGYVAILDNLDKCLGEIFNLGLDTAITTGEGIKALEKAAGMKAKFEIRPKRAGDQEETRANIDKARKILGYNPTTTPEEGLLKEFEWYKEKIWQKINLYQ
jgi:UDP-glucuronate 4-epimerase